MNCCLNCGGIATQKYMGDFFCDDCFIMLDKDSYMKSKKEPYHFAENYKGYEIWVSNESNIKSLVLKNHLLVKEATNLTQAEYWVDWNGDLE